MAALTPIDWDRAFRLRETENWSFARIAREYGCAQKKIRIRLMDLGAHGRPRARKSKAARALRELFDYTHAKCEQPNHVGYARNGAEGARVDKEWDEFEPFYQWAMGTGYRPGKRLALRVEFGPYASWNCTWITTKEVVATRKRPRGRTRLGQTQRLIDYERAKQLFLEEGVPVMEVARRLGASYTGLRHGFIRLGIRLPKQDRPTSTPEGRRLRQMWLALRRRCARRAGTPSPARSERNYRISKEWRTFEPFFQWATTSGSKPGLCLLRIVSSKPFGPTNCRWGARVEVTSVAFRPIRAFGETKSITRWSRDPRCTVTLTTIRNRLAGGWKPEEAITTKREGRGGSKGRIVELVAFGQTKATSGWLHDKRCLVGYSGLMDRLRRRWSTEDAISTPPHQQPNSRKKAIRSRPRGS